MKRNGFTLIELLAVIVILAIIALIATPIILGIINDARKESNERSAELYASAVKNAIASYQLTHPNAPKTFEDLDVQYDGNVVCATEELYADGSFYMGDCTVNGDTVDYIYGEKQGSEVAKVCTRQNDSESFDTVTCTIDGNIESFYVLNNYITNIPSNKILMVTKYNLDTTTHRQSQTADEIYFANTHYWSNEETDIYDKRNDLIGPIVEGYVGYLNEHLIEEASGSLLTLGQLEELGCSNSNVACSGAPSWVYSTTYWSGTVIENNVRFVTLDGDIHGSIYAYSQSAGVRPVITISTSEIQ